MITLIGVLFLLSGTSEGSHYSREAVQEKYPGFGTDYILFRDSNGNPIYAYLKDDGSSRIIPYDEAANIQNISFTLYNRQNPTGVLLKDWSLLSTYLTNTKPIKIVTHGWISSGNADSCIRIKNAYLNKSDVDVFVLDWAAVADNTVYIIPMEATSAVGKRYGEFLNYLVEQMNVSASNIHLIGHSLGAHVSGFAGRHVTKGKVGRITGLDPALPGFVQPYLVPDERLKSTDALFVDIIHTCAGFLGIREPIGHLDFYPNGGGPPQPGCGALGFIEACSHSRSWKLFAASIELEGRFLSTECTTFTNMQTRRCRGATVPMGDPAPPTARGVYYLTTTGQEPYLVNQAKHIKSRDME